jgi:hypothetical protein
VVCRSKGRLSGCGNRDPPQELHGRWKGNGDEKVLRHKGRKRMILRCTVAIAMAIMAATIMTVSA